MIFLSKKFRAERAYCISKYDYLESKNLLFYFSKMLFNEFNEDNI